MKLGIQSLFYDSGAAFKIRGFFRYGFVLVIMLFGLMEAYAQSTVTVRFANPQYDCAAGEYCVDVEFQSDTPNEQLFGMNVRFFYDEDILEFAGFSDFQGGYGPVSPNPPFINTGNANSGPDLFGYTGPAEFINGAVQLVDNMATPIPISTTDWTKLYQVCFTVDDPNPDLDNFCPSITWDLEVDPADGGFLTGDDGVVITLVNPNPNLDSEAAIENVDQFNWAYSGPGTAPYGMPVENECTQIRCADLSLDKAVSDATPAIGDNVVFTITVDNAGPNDATMVEVTDQLPDGYLYVSDNGGVSYDDGTGIWAVGTVAGGGSATLEITATVLPVGNYVNLAEVTMANGIDDDSTPGNGADTDMDGNVGIDDDPDDEDDGDDAFVSPIIDPSLRLYKTVASVSGTGGVGDMITYAFEVTNTGDVPISNIDVMDILVSVSGGPILTLAPGDSDNTTFTATYTITQADVDAGYVQNTATTSGTDIGGGTVTDVSDAGNDNVETLDGEDNFNGDPTDDPTVQPLNQNPDIAIIKTSSVGGTGSVGDVITYTFTVENTGDVTLTNVTVTDPLPGLSAITPASVASMAPGAVEVFSATYTISQTDIDNGSVTNQATSTGTDPDGMDVTDLSDDNSNLEDDPTDTPLNQNPDIAIIKTSSVGGTGSVGDVITYTFTVENTGDVTLTNVTVTDPLPGLSAINPVSVASMAPGAVEVFSATYTISQTDIDNGSVTNQATSTGTDPDGMDVTDLSDDNSNLEDDPTDTPLNQNPDIAIIKTSSVGGTGSVGDVITYTFTVENTGDVTLTNVMVTDPLPGLSAINPVSVASMAPGAVEVFSATYTISQTDIDNGSVTNQATSTGTDPDGMDVTDLSDDNSNLEDDPTDTPLNQNPDIAIIKTSSVGGTGSVGDVITYTFTVENTGDVTLTNVMVTDPLPGLSAINPVSVASMAPGAVEVFSATYTISQTDIDNGSVTNQATSTGTDPDGMDVTDLSDDNSNLEDDPTDTPLNQNPDIAIIKTSSVGGTGSVGDVITYTFTVENTGDVTLTNVMVTDPLPGLSAITPASVASMAPGAVEVFSATYTISQTDIDNGSVTNQATSTGTDPDGMDVTDLSDDNSNLEDDPTDTPLGQNPDIAIIKTSSVGGTGSVGDVITYTFTVENTGDVTLTNVTVTDPLPGLSAINPVSVASMAPGAVEVFSATYTISQTDIDNGSVTNQATSTGTDPDGMDVTDLSDDNSNLEDDPTDTPLGQNPDIAIIKTSSVGGTGSVGDVITYTFTVENTGDVTLTNVMVTDPLPGLSAINPVSVASMAPGAVEVFSATYIITQADIDNGGVTNQALATGTDPDGMDVTDDSDDNSNLEDDPTETPLNQNPDIAIIKTSSVGGTGSVGDVITYTFTVENTGDVTLTNVTVTDPLPGLSAIAPASVASMAPGAVEVFSATYIITQADIDNGGVTNQALATGTDPDGMDVTDDSDDNSNLEDDPTETPLNQNPDIAIIKTSSVGGTGSVGDVITYTFTVENTGDVTLTNVTVTDPLPGLSAIAPASVASMAPGAVEVFSATYIITQADIDNGGVTNQALATGTDPDGMDVTDDSDDNSNLEDDPTDTPLGQNPDIAIIKTSSVGGTGSVGDVITYTFTVENTGDVTLTNVTVTDPLPGLSAITPASVASMAPGAVEVFSATYIITQADIDNGGVTNQALATGTDPDGMDVTDDSDDNSNLEDDPTDTPLGQNPDIAIIKTSSVGGTGSVGDVITYTFTVENTGDVTLTNVTVTDPLPGLSAINPVSVASMAPGAVEVFSATYIITQADIDNGGVTNQALATGTDPDGMDVTDDSDDNSNLEDDPTETPLNQNPDIAIIKTSSVGGTGSVGDVITYTFTVENTGDVTLTNVTVTDPLPGLSAIAPASVASMAPGAVEVFSATYIITQADIDNGGVTNQALATGTDPDGMDVTDDSDDNSNLEDDPTETPLNQNPDIAIIKTSSVGGTGSVGDVITYTFTVENTGDVTLTNVTVTDPLPGLSAIAPASVASMAPGAVEVFSATYIITQADIDNGGVTNQALATGTDPDGMDVTDDSDDNSNLEDDPTDTPLGQNPDIAIIKTSSVGGTGSVGDVITYTFTVENTGDVTLTNVTVTDPLPGLSAINPVSVASMAPGAVEVFSATYIITQADIDNGGVTNQALATGTDPDGMDVTDDSDDNSNLEDDPTDTPLGQNPDIAIIKTSSVGGTGSVGDVITYTFTVENTGDVTLTNVTVTDPLPGLSAINPVSVASMAPGAVEVFSATYIITQADIDNGGVTNQALATGTDPDGMDVTDDSDDNSNLEDDPTETPLNQNPDIAIIKTSLVVDTNNDGFAQVGETINYTFTVENTGDVTLTNVTVTDPLPGLSAITPASVASMAPGAVEVFSATYTITQADIDNGGVTNQALATGTDPDGMDVTDDSDDDSNLEDDPTETPFDLPAVISGHLYVDTNGNGMQDAGEPDLPNVDVIITDANGDMQTVTTDANGDYTANVVAGTTVVDVDNSDPDFLTGSTQTEGDDPTIVIAVVNMNTDAGNDGYFLPALLTGNVYEDLNGNGNQDSGEPGLPNIDVIITDSNGDMETVTTDANGDWGVSVPPGVTVVDVDNNDPDFPTPSTQTEGDDPTTVTAVAGMTLSGGIDGYNRCLTIEAWVYLEGSAIDENGLSTYSLPMRTSLNDLRVLPGQVYMDPFFGAVYNPAGQPYNIAPWNYNGQEGAGFDSGGDMAFSDANYPSDVVDWVLVSLRETPDAAGGVICEAAALLHADGTIEFIDGFSCCNVDFTQSYYLVVEHRNHLIVMSDAPVDIVNGTLTYDFRTQESYIDDPFGFGAFVGQKEILTGVFAMFAGNGNQTDTGNSDTDINFDDRTYWEGENGIIGDYRNGDYNMNGDTNFNDRTTWENNNGNITSVPRD